MCYTININPFTGAIDMLIPFLCRKEEGAEIISFHIKGSVPYDYYYEDVSTEAYLAEILDDIFTRDCIPAWMADVFAAHYIDLVATLDRELKLAGKSAPEQSADLPR